MESYGHFTFNTEAKNIASVDTSNQKGFIIDPVAFAYDFGARMYDARLGIFLSVEPLARKYPDLSPYVAFNNNPIYFVDPTGKDGVAIIDKQSKTITIKAVYYAQTTEIEGVYPTFTTKFTAKDIEKLNTKVNKTLNDAAYTVSEGEYQGYNVKFDLQFKEGGTRDEAVELASKEKYGETPIGNAVLKGDETVYPSFLKSEKNEETGQVKSRPGVTLGNKTIIVKGSSDLRQKIHEMFHTLFFNKDAAKEGIGNYKPGVDLPNQQDINDLINNPQLPKKEETK